MNLLNDLAQHIKKASYILIAGHVSPDGDAIGATTAMGLLLGKMGKEYGILLEQPDQKYDYLLNTANVISDTPIKQCDLFIALDCGDLERLGPFKEAFENAHVSWNIDHHISNTNYGIYNYVDVNASSASEIVFDIYKHLGTELDFQIAQALYTGIVYDTAAFKHSNTSSKTLKIASELISYNFDFSAIIQKLFYEKPLATVKLEGAAITNIESYFENNLIISSLSLEEISLYSEDTKGASGIVNALKNIKNSKVAAFLYEKSEGEIKLSLRSEDPYNICQIAESFGGGGHIKAAGATLHTSLEKAKENILPLLMNLFQ